MNLSNKKTVNILVALKQEKNALMGNASFKKLADAGEVQCCVTGMGRKSIEFLKNHETQLLSSACIVNAGICGALNKTIRLYNTVFPKSISYVKNKEVYPVPQGHSGHLTTLDQPVLLKKEKLSLPGDFVDMEAVHIAEFCSKRNIPFTIVKVVSDTPDTEDNPTAHLYQAKQALLHLAEPVIRSIDIIIKELQ